MIGEKEKLQEIVVQQSSLELLAANRIQVIGQFGSNNRISFASPVEPQANLRVRFNGFSDTQISLGAGNKFSGDLYVCGDETRFSVGQSDYTVQACVFLYTKSAAVEIGRMCSANMINIVSWGPGGRVLIGDHCMFSFNIWVRASDEHGIIDFTKDPPVQTNLPQDVIIDSGVWIGQDVLVLKGVTVGRGSIIGARSLVTASVPEFVLVSGTPARIMKTNVTWSRHSKPTSDQIIKEISHKHALPTIQS